MQIGKALKYGNPGEKIAVQLLNGKVVSVVAGNVINSTQVLVAGGYCWSSTSPVEQTKDRYVFKTKGTPKVEGEICQLVAASVFTSSVRLQNINTIPPYDIAPHYRRVIFPENPTWKYINGNKCRLVDSGNGEYDSLNACLLANETEIPNTYVIGKNSVTASFYNPNRDFIANPVFSSNIYISRQTTVFFSYSPRYIVANNGDLVENLSGGEGIDQNGKYRVKITISSNKNIVEGQKVWFYAVIKNRETGNIFVQRRNFFDGSIFNTITREYFTEAEFTCFDDNCFKFNVSDLSYQEAASLFFNTRHSVSIPFELEENNRDKYQVLDLRVSLTVNVSIVRNCIAEYNYHETITGFFVKFHDPNLPLIKAFEFFPGQREPTTIESTFVFLGNKAYLINKLGKIKAPETPFLERPWFKVLVIELAIEEEGNDNYIVNKQEFSYYNPEGFTTDKKNVLSPLTDRHDTNSTGDPCLDNEDYFLLSPKLNLEEGGYGDFNKFREVSYQELSNGQIIEYKIPGAILDRNRNKIVFDPTQQ